MERPALSASVHLECDAGTGAQGTQQQLIGIGSLVLTAQLLRFIGLKTMASGLDLLGEGALTPCDYHLCHSSTFSLIWDFSYLQLFEDITSQRTQKENRDACTSWNRMTIGRPAKELRSPPFQRRMPSVVSSSKGRQS